MSVENVKAFLEKMNDDQAFGQKIREASNDEERFRIAREAGFEFTAAELNRTLMKVTEEELTEDQLDSVAGGWVAYETWPKSWKTPGSRGNFKFEIDG